MAEIVVSTPLRLLEDIRTFLVQVGKGPLPMKAARAAALLDRLDEAHPPRRPDLPAPPPAMERLPFG